MTLIVSCMNQEKQIANGCLLQPPPKAYESPIINTTVATRPLLVVTDGSHQEPAIQHFFACVRVTLCRLMEWKVLHR